MDMKKDTTVEQQLETELTLTQTNFASRMFNAPLAALRAQNPFVRIEQFPGVISAKLTANTAQDINFPEGTKMVKFKGNGDYYVTRNGVAVVPALTFAAGSDGSGVLYKPEDVWIFTGEEVKQVSVIAPVDCILSVSYIQQQ